MPGTYISRRGMSFGSLKKTGNITSGLLLNLADAGDPSLDFRTKTANKPTSLRTSDRNSLLRYMGLPLHTFGKVSVLADISIQR
jgi:hypothetical protein